jgi:hypothetical protein
MEYRIILGLGDEHLNELVKTSLEASEVGKVVGLALTRKNVMPRLMEQGANMVFLGEYLIGETKSEDEWVALIEDLRRVDMQMRIVFFCDRPDSDLFLTKLVMIHVTDIFNQGELPSGWTAQLKEAPKYESTERFRVNNGEDAIQELKNRKRKAQESPDEILQLPHIPKEQKVKIVEKKIVEKQIVFETVKIPSRSVAVVSLFDSAGSSILTRMLAEYVASLQVEVGVLESATAHPCWYEMMNAYTMLEDNKDWESWHQTVKRGEQIPAWSDTLKLNGVQYIVRDPKDSFTEWTESDTAYLLAYSRNLPVLFCDVSGRFDDPREQIILRSAQTIILVGGYDVVRMEREHDRYMTFLAPFKDKLLFVMNKSTRRLERTHSAEIKNVYETKQLFHVPAMNEINELYMEGESFWSCNYIKEEQKQNMREVMDRLAGEILGDSIVKKLRSRNKGSLFSRVGAYLMGEDNEVEADETTA